MSKSPVEERLKVVLPVPELVKVRVSAESWVMVVFSVKAPPHLTVLPDSFKPLVKV